MIHYNTTSSAPEGGRPCNHIHLLRMNVTVHTCKHFLYNISIYIEDQSSSSSKHAFHQVVFVSEDNKCINAVKAAASKFSDTITSQFEKNF